MKLRIICNNNSAVFMFCLLNFTKQQSVYYMKQHSALDDYHTLITQNRNVDMMLPTQASIRMLHIGINNFLLDYLRHNFVCLVTYSCIYRWSRVGIYLHVKTDNYNKMHMFYWSLQFIRSRTRKNKYVKRSKLEGKKFYILHTSTIRLKN